jgi:hypothetical protein
MKSVRGIVQLLVRKPRMEFELRKDAQLRFDVVPEENTINGVEVENGTVYEVRVHLTRNATTDIYGVTTYTNWNETFRERVAVIAEEVETAVPVKIGYEGPEENKTRYVTLVDRKRNVSTSLSTGKKTYGQWVHCNERRLANGTRTVTRRVRQRKQEEMIVDYHRAHSMRGFSSKPHTHWKVFHHTFRVEWNETIDYDGRKTVSKETEVPGTRQTVEIKNGRTHGHDMRPYIQDIA